MRAVLILLLLSSLSACAGPTEYRAEEATWQAVHLADALQTAQIEHTPGVYEAESAWAIGHEPSHQSVIAYFAAESLLHAAAVHYAADHNWPPWLVRTFEAVSLYDSLTCVEGNWKLGLRP